MREGLRVERQRPALQAFQPRRAVRISGRNQVHVSRTQHQVARVPDAPLTARDQHDHRVRVDEGAWSGATVLVTAVATQPDG